MISKKRQLLIITAIVIVLSVIVVNYLRIPMTGRVVISYENDADFLNGTFTNTSLSNGVIKLNKTLTLTPVGEYNNASSLVDPYDLFVLGDYAYVISLNNDSLTILDITDKSNPFFVGYYNDSDPPYSLDYAFGIFVSGDYVYALSKNDQCLTILDISNKANPTPAGSYNDSESLAGVHSVYVLDDYAYVTAWSNDSLRIFNVTNKTNITLTGSYVNSELPYSLDGARELFVSGDYAYVISSLDNALTILNISNKSNPTPVGDYNDTEPPYSLNSAYGVFVLDDYAYVTASGNDSLTILNISNKSNPTPVGDYNDTEPPYSIDSPRTVFVSGNYSYVTSWVDDSLTVLDISNKSNITPVASYNNSALPYSLDAPNSVHVLADYAYVTTYSDGITIFKIEFPYGTYESTVFDATFTADWETVSWSETQPSQTSLSLAFRSCDDVNCSGESWSSWNENSPDSLTEISNNRYFQFKAKLETTNVSKIPHLNSVSITYSQVTSSDTDTGGGSGNLTLQPPKEIHIWTKITPGVVTIMKDFDEEIGVKQIQIEVNNEAQDVKMTITKYDDKPANVSIAKSGKVYQYLQIETENLEDKLEKGTVTIRINKSWVSENNLDKDKIALFKFINNEWTELTTIYREENGDYYYYDIELDSFSYFAIGGKVEEISEFGEDVRKLKGNIGEILLWIIVAILIISIVTIFFLIRNLITKNSENLIRQF